ncbi:WhiB family transcriptional regulator [Streptomyces sp. NPDC002537]
MTDQARRLTLPMYLTGATGLAHWSLSAACIEVDAEMFFPHGHTGEAGMESARKICAGCPVVAECLEHAMSVPERYGIWGGTTPSERGWDCLGRKRKGRNQKDADA